jgi:outer membrane protein TolC
MTGHRFKLMLALLLLILPATAAYAQEKRSRSQSSSSQSGSLGDSVESGTVTPDAIPLTIIDAIHRGLKNNLAVIFGSLNLSSAEASRLRDRSDLLPKINGQLSAAEQQVNLAAYGFTGFAGVPPIIGPFGLVDARASFSQSLLDKERTHNYREATENEKAVALGNENTREMVVLTVLDLYYQSVSGASRVSAVEAQVSSAQALNIRAADLKSAGVAPGIDVLRAQVELQSAQQRLIQARNEFSREKLSLARAIGMPLGQEFILADSLPGGSSPSESIQDLLSRAYASRSDAKAAQSRFRAAQEAVKAAQSENLPTARVDANYGATGPNPLNAHGTFYVAGTVQFPIFNSKSKSDTMEKESLLQQRQAEIDSLHGRIELDVRSALLELQSAEEQYKVSLSSLALVRQQLEQAQDRFAAGVANNLEVVQAQEALALADENVIKGLYAFNASRAMLAHATGVAEKSVEEMFGGSRKP